MRVKHLSQGWKEVAQGRARSTDHRLMRPTLSHCTTSPLLCSINYQLFFQMNLTRLCCIWCYTVKNKGIYSSKFESRVGSFLSQFFSRLRRKSCFAWAPLRGAENLWARSFFVCFFSRLRRESRFAWRYGAPLCGATHSNIFPLPQCIILQNFMSFRPVV